MEGRYTAFLNSARVKSSQSQKDVEQNPQYQQLNRPTRTHPRLPSQREMNCRNKDRRSKRQILAVQNVFTDRRAYVNALTYELETDTSASGKKSKQQDIDEYKKNKATVEFPDGTNNSSTSTQLEETYNSLKDQRTKMSAELGDVLKPVTEARQA